MFKISLKVGCSLIYVSAQLKKSSFIFKTTKDEMAKFATIMANCVENNL